MKRKLLSVCLAIVLAGSSVTVNAAENTAQEQQVLEDGNFSSEEGGSETLQKENEASQDKEEIAEEIQENKESQESQNKDETLKEIQNDGEETGDTVQSQIEQESEDEKDNVEGALKEVEEENDIDEIPDDEVESKDELEALEIQQENEKDDIEIPKKEVRKAGKILEDEEKTLDSLKLEVNDGIEPMGAPASITVKNVAELTTALKNAAKSATAKNPYTINVKAGIYNITSALAIYSHVIINTEKETVLNISKDITVNSYVTLNLQGSTIKYSGEKSKYALYIKPGVKDVSIMGGIVEGGGVYLNKAQNIEIKNTVFRRYKENGVFAKESTLNSIEGVQCYGGITGISLTESKAETIKNCKLQDFTDNGIKLTGEGAVVTEISKNDLVSVSKEKGNETNGIYLKDGAQTGSIKNNEVNTCYIGIYIVGARVGSISNNKVLRVGEHGIYLANNSLATGSISGNTVKSFKRSAIQLYTGCTVKGKIINNVIQDGKGTGILITGPTNKKKGSVVGNIEKNNISNCTGDGIGIYHASHCGSIKNNKLDTIGGNHNGNEGDYGIIVDSMMKADTYCKDITNNEIKNVTYAAIAIYSGPSASTSTIYQDTAYVKGNIANNKIINSGTYKPSKDWKQEIANGGKKGCLSGIYVDTHARVKGDICNNTVDIVGEHGIYIHLMSFVRSIYGNSVTNSKEAGIEIFESTVEKDIYDNTISNAGTNGIAGGRNGIVKGKIRDNIIKNTKGCGIYLDLSKFTEISKNKISGVKKHGIYVTDKSTATKIQANTISMSNAVDGCGIKTSEDSIIAKIHKNKIEGKMSYGVRTAGAMRNMEISNNTMTTSNSSKEQFNPIRLMNGRGFTYTVKNNNITGNKTNYGIRIEVGKAQITGNTVKKMTYPIYVKSNKYVVTIKDNKISENKNNSIKTAGKKITTNKVELQSVKNLKGNKAKVSWKKRKDISNYLVYQSEKKGKSYKKIEDVRGNSYTIPRLKKRKTYYYKVRGYQKDGNVMVYTDWSQEKSLKITK
ncbi:MAG: hypothetical protein HFI76_00040 [Lachnospiraceae bacterium]|nr:hypothetical protein [Lachnospiraceae bacterium]